MAICSGTTKSGAPCKARAAKCSDYCHRHAPADETPESPRAIAHEPDVSAETEGSTASEPIMSAMPAYVDRRPSPPPNARTTEPGKAQPYDKIEDLLTVFPFHGEKRATGINNSSLDKVRMPKKKGSSLKTTDGWLGALIKKTESMATHVCCAKGCTKNAEVGAHIWLYRGENDEADLTTAYIVPTCKDHNSRKFDFGKYSNSFVVKAGTPCISMPPHAMYSDFKGADEL